jgi:hypothetical protein
MCIRHHILRQYSLEARRLIALCVCVGPRAHSCGDNTREPPDTGSDPSRALAVPSVYLSMGPALIYIHYRCV